MAQPPGQQLSSKEQGLFRQVVRHFESKQYKKGLKTAEQILKKNPNHADTQAMKALILHSQGHTQEAFDLAKIALKNNMKSHVCWHVYGLLWRGEKNFEESIKAYKFALKLEPDSQPIQRDLAHLQIQMRDFDGYIDSRRNMLQQKPGFRQNWTALAIAHHLAGNYEDAERVLTTYEETLKTKPTRSDMEHWEAILYKNYVIAESGQVEKALEHLDAVGKKSPDVLGVMEMRADYLLRLGRNDEAKEAYTALMDRNPENSAYYEGFVKASGLENAEPAAAKKVYDELSQKYPRSDMPRRRPLDFLTGDEFRASADVYLQRMLRKGVPSTFANIKQLYGDQSKLQIVQDLVEGYADGNVSTQPNGSVEPTEKETKNFEWSVPYFLAQHYNFGASRDLQKALDYADKCLALDLKSVDFHAVKARTYKYMGNISKAAELMNQARELDLKDRAINTKCAKYQLRHDENEKALETAGKFTQNKTSGGPLADLLDMQCVWYLVEDGHSYLRQHKLGLALKRFHQILKIFEVWQDDQFDFHNFSLRKGMIRAYIDMLRWEDHLRDHPFFPRMAILGIRSYIMLADNPDLVHGPIMNGMNGAANGKMSEADRKKALKKAKREQEKLEKAEADKKALQKAAKPVPKADADDARKEDTDPLGKTLVETKEPLEDAMKFLTPLLESNAGLVEAQKVAFEVYIRRKKYLLATKSLLAMRAISPTSPDLHVCAFQLRKAVEAKPEGLSDQIAEIIKSEAKDLLHLQFTPAEWNEAFGKKLKTQSLRHLQAFVQVRDMLDAESRAQNERELVDSAGVAGADLPAVVEGLEVLQRWGASEKTIDSYKENARQTWSEADAFATSNN